MKWNLVLLYLANANLHQAGLRGQVIFCNLQLSCSWFSRNYNICEHIYSSWNQIWAHDYRLPKIHTWAEDSPDTALCAKWVFLQTFRESGSGMISIAVNICPEQLADYLHNNLISAILNNTNIFFSSFVPWQWCHFKYSLYKYATLELPKNCIRYSSWHESNP